MRTEVTVIITDINDETPTFRSKRYACEITENAPTNTPLTFLGHVNPQVFDHDQVWFKPLSYWVKIVLLNSTFIVVPWIFASKFIILC